MCLVFPTITDAASRVSLIWLYTECFKLETAVSPWGTYCLQPSVPTTIQPTINNNVQYLYLHGGCIVEAHFPFCWNMICFPSTHNNRSIASFTGKAGWKYGNLTDYEIQSCIYQSWILLGRKSWMLVIFRKWLFPPTPRILPANTNSSEYTSRIQAFYLNTA